MINLINAALAMIAALWLTYYLYVLACLLESPYFWDDMRDDTVQTLTTVLFGLPFIIWIIFPVVAEEFFNHAENERQEQNRRKEAGRLVGA